MVKRAFTVPGKHLLRVITWTLFPFLQAVAFMMHSLLYDRLSLPQTGDHIDEHSMFVRQTQLGSPFRILQIIPGEQRTALQRSTNKRRHWVG
jgi:hypothetical protein